jgi:hypothetical protein
MALSSHTIEPSLLEARCVPRMNRPTAPRSSLRQDGTERSRRTGGGAGNEQWGGGWVSHLWETPGRHPQRALSETGPCETSRACHRRLKNEMPGDPRRAPAAPVRLPPLGHAAPARLAECYHDESCGQCSPCREGTGWLEKMLYVIPYRRSGSVHGLCPSYSQKNLALICLVRIRYSSCLRRV